MAKFLSKEEITFHLFGGNCIDVIKPTLLLKDSDESAWIFELEIQALVITYKDPLSLTSKHIDLS